MKKICWILSLAGLTLAGARGAEPTPYRLTLDDCIAIAKKQSYTMRSLREDLKIAEYNLNWATSRLKTHIDLRLTAPQFDDEIVQWKDSTGISFYSSKMLDLGGNLTINQPLPTDGRIFIEAGMSSFNDFTYDKRSSSLSTVIGFSQPLDIIYGYSSIRTDLKKAKLNYERTSKALKRDELDLVFNVSSRYYNLLALQRQVEISRLDLQRQTEAYELSKNKYSAGLIREVDALQMEVEWVAAQNSYDVALLDLNAAMKQFKNLIGLELDDPVTLDGSLKYSTVFVDADLAVQYALDNRLEIRDYEIQIEEQKLGIKQQKVQGRVRGSIDAYVRKMGVSNPNTDFDMGTSLRESAENFINFSDAFRPNYGVGFTVTVPILDWGENKALVRAAEARLKQIELARDNQLQVIETEVRNLVEQLNSSLKRLQLLERNVAVAEKSFDITRRRYADGDIDSQALALERGRLNNAYLSHLSAYTSYRLALADLMRKTFYDFERGLPVE